MGVSGGVFCLGRGVCRPQSDSRVSLAFVGGSLVPELQRHALRGADLVTIRGVFPLHDRQFNLRLVSHLTRHVFLQAHMLHQLRNVYGEKVAFLFAFRNFYQRCLLVPALLGVLLSLSQRCFSRVRSPAQARTPPTSTAARSLA